MSERKVGAEVACPRCQAQLTVPTKEAGLAAVNQWRQAHRGSALPSDFEDVAVMFDRDATGSTTAPIGSRPLAPLGSAMPRMSDPNMILVSRQAMFAQGAVIATVALFFLFVGYLIGSAVRPETPQPTSEPAVQRPLPQQPPPPAPVRREPVEIVGQISYKAAAGQSVPDALAVVLVFPEGEVPDDPVPIEGLKATDPAPVRTHRGVQAITTLGGAYVRTDAAGEFRLRLLPGTYRMLLISRNTVRPRNQPIDREHITELSDFVQLAPALIGEQKYRWETIQVADGRRVDRDFGRTRE